MPENDSLGELKGVEFEKGEAISPDDRLLSAAAYVAVQNDFHFRDGIDPDEARHIEGLSPGYLQRHQELAGQELDNERFHLESERKIEELTLEILREQQKQSVERDKTYTFLAFGQGLGALILAGLIAWLRSWEGAAAAATLYAVMWAGLARRSQHTGSTEFKASIGDGASGNKED